MTEGLLLSYRAVSHKCGHNPDETNEWVHMPPYKYVPDEIRNNVSVHDEKRSHE